MIKKRLPVFYGWWVVATAAIALSLSPAAMVVFSFSVFLKPLAQELHSSRAAISLAFTLFNLMVGICSPAAGKLTDRFPARKVIVPCTVACVLILFASNALSAKLWEICAFYLALGLFGSGTSIVPYSKVVSHWFDRRRGIALGLMAVGGGCAAMIMPSLAQRIITQVGWRLAYTTMAALTLLIAIPLIATFLKECPEEPRIARDASSQLPIARRGDSGASWREVRRRGAFWLVLCAYCFVGTGIHGCFIHMSALLSDRGTSLKVAALASSLIGAGSITGRLLSGYLLDRFFALKVAKLTFGAIAVAMALLGIPGRTDIAFPAAFVIGLGLGAEGDIIAYLISRYFGLRSFGEIYGYAFSAFVLTGALGPLLMGAGFDRMGSYLFPLLIFSAAALAAAIFVSRLGPYRYVASEDTARRTTLHLQPAEES
jgi:predicted MFS family arabinose efflux permease